MKLGELFIQLGVKGDLEPLKEALKLMDGLKRRQKSILELSEKLNGKPFLALDIKGNIKSLSAVLAIMKEVQEQQKLIVKASKDKAFEQIEKTQKQVEKTQQQVEKTQKKIEDEQKKADEKSKLLEKQKNLNAIKDGFKKIFTVVSGGIIVFDRLANAMFKANQQMVNFNRQTGISFATLNKYASASAMVNYGASVEKTANSLQTLANNLWDIRMGRGDLSPYQELAFVGGKGINPVGKSVEQVVEEVRESIKGVGDLQATNLITRMGFSPDDLLMLRMTREEFEKINSLFLNPADRETLNSFAKQLKVIHLELSLMGQKIMLKVMPIFLKLMDAVRDSAKLWTTLGSGIYNVINAMPHLATSFKILAVSLTGALFALNPLIIGLGSLYLLIEDIAVHFMGGKSVFGTAIEGFKNLGADLAKLNPFADNEGGINGFIRGVTKLNALSVPPVLHALIQSGFAIDKLGGASFGGLFNRPIEWATDKILSPAQHTNNSSKTFNQNNNISLNTNGAVAPQVADTIAQYTSVIGQNVAYG